MLNRFLVKNSVCLWCAKLSKTSGSQSYITFTPRAGAPSASSTQEEVGVPQWPLGPLLPPRCAKGFLQVAGPGKSEKLKIRQSENCVAEAFPRVPG